MNKLFGLFLLALACWAPDVAQAANRFAVCTTTCTWDNTSTAMWSTTSGGATGASAPTTADVAILDAATCVGGTTCTVTTFAGTITVNELSMDACTASTAGCILEASTNNTNFTITGGNGFHSTGSGTRTLNMGSGTWTLSNSFTVWNVASTITINAGTSTIAATGNAGVTFTGGGKTYSTVTLAAVSNPGAHTFNNNNTFGTLTIAAPNRIQLGTATQTVTTLTNVSGTSTSQVFFAGNVLFGAGVLSIGNAWVCDWCGFTMVTRSGAGSATATNSANLNGNTGITISPPAGAGGGRIIGG
jgi:hypothetical protein